MRRLGIALLVSLSLYSCAPESSHSGPERVANNPESLPENNVPQSNIKCEYRYDEGASIRDVPAPNITTTWFGKRFDLADLEVVLPASASDTARFIEKLDAHVYRVDTKTKECRFFALLSPAPKDLNSFWKRAAGGTQGGTLGGLYLEEKAEDENGRPLPSLDHSSAILIRDVGTRWELVHEMMHHLFTRQAFSEPGARTNVELKTALLNLADQLEGPLTQFQRAPTLELLQQIVPSFVSYHSVVSELMRRYPLEEMTIENTLIDNFTAGRLKFSTDKVNNGINYIRLSADRANQVFMQVGNIAAFLSRQAAGLGDAENKVILDRILAQLTADIQAVRSFPHVAIGVGNMPLAAASYSAGADHSDCGHSGERVEAQVAHQNEKLLGALAGQN